MPALTIILIVLGLVVFGIAEVQGQSLLERLDYERHRED